MLQLTGSLRNATAWITSPSSWRIYAQQLLAASSRAAEPNPTVAQRKEEIGSLRRKPVISNRVPITSVNPMVQIVMKNLKHSEFNPASTKVDDRIQLEINKAENVESLLNLAKDKNITRQNAFAIVTLLLNWVKNSKVKLEVFEVDNRFLHLCMLLSWPIKQKNPNHTSKISKEFMKEENFFCNIHDINDATREMANLSVQQMVEVMAGLASQKKRNTPLLRVLSFSITQSSEALDIKGLSDLLYSMSILNYADEVLLQKICGVLIETMRNVPTSSIIGSILRSLGTLRYNNGELMDTVSNWVVDHAKDMRFQDLCTFFITLAILGHTPTNVQLLNKFVVNHLNESDTTKPSEWLDVVWALTVLQLAQKRHIASVLNSTFIQKLTASIDNLIPKKYKLLNINGAAQLLMKDYKGPLLERGTDIFNTSIRRPKDKEIYAQVVTGTINHIFPSPRYCKTNINTGIGFLLDAEVCINNKGKRLPLEHEMDKNNGFRLAVIAQSYHDFSRGKCQLLGLNNFCCRILEAKGYKILSIPHTEFRADDKLVQRITYINDRIKNIAK